jgi:hypothetical protein
MIQKTNAVYSELHTRTSRYKSTQRFVSNDPGDFCSCAPPLDATSFENGYPTTEELVCSAVSEERVCNSCATWISHTISHGTTQPSIHLRLVQEIRAQRVHLQKKESLSALCVWCKCIWCNYRLDICRVTRGAHIVSMRCVQNFESSSIDWCRCEVLNAPHLFSISFWRCKVLLCSPCITQLHTLLFKVSCCFQRNYCLI